MLGSKFKKQVGFIKAQGSKTDLREQHRQDSSDSFSSFQYEPRHRNDQFSPYKHPIPTISHTKIASQPKSKPQMAAPPKKQLQSSHPRFSNMILRNNFIQQAKIKQKDTHQKVRQELIQQELQDISQQIKAVRKQFRQSQEEFQKESEGEQTPKLPDHPPQAEQEGELSLSNIDRFKKTEQQFSSNPIPQEQEQGYPKTLAQYKRYLEQSSSQSEEEEVANKQTLKNKSNLAKREPEEELIAEWDKREFKDKRIKTAVLERNAQNIRPQHHEGVLETKGGFCFEIDKKEFKSISNRRPPEQKPRKKAPTNTRQQLLIRRQTAKRFDKQSRTRLFGYS